MGIYDSGTIFGIRIYNFNEDDVSNILFEKTYHETMSYTQKKEVYRFYTGLNDKTGIHFQYYTECSSTYEKRQFLKWCPMTLTVFLEKFRFE